MGYNIHIQIIKNNKLRRKKSKTCERYEHMFSICYYYRQFYVREKDEMNNLSNILFWFFDPSLTYNGVDILTLLLVHSFFFSSIFKFFSSHFFFVFIRRCRFGSLVIWLAIMYQYFSFIYMYIFLLLFCFVKERRGEWNVIYLYFMWSKHKTL